MKKDGFIELTVFDKSPEVSSIIAMKSNDILQKSIINFKLKNISDVYNFTLKQLKLAQNNLFEIQDSLANFKDSNKNIKSILFSNQLKRLKQNTIFLKIYIMS